MFADYRKLVNCFMRLNWWFIGAIVADLVVVAGIIVLIIKVI